MKGPSNSLAFRTHTFATSGALADVDAFKTAIATTTAAITYSGATLTGALANPGPVTEAKMGLPRYPSVTTSASVGTYNITDAIVFTGTRNGAVATVSLTLTDADGGQTIVCGDDVEPLDTLTSIAVPAQVDTNGQFEFGFSSIGFRRLNAFGQRLAFKPLATGTVKCGYAGGFTDNLPVTSHQLEHVSPNRIYADTTDVGVTVYE